MSTVIRWATEWVETFRVAPPFSRRRRELIEMSAEIENPDAWSEVQRPGGAA